MVLMICAFVSGCTQHPLLGTWTFPELEQAWDIANKGKIQVSYDAEDQLCTDQGRNGTVLQCHEKRVWTQTDPLTIDGAEIESFRFVIYKMTAQRLGSRVENCVCLANPDVYFGVIDNNELLLFDSNTDTRNMVDRGKHQDQ